MRTTTWAFVAGAAVGYYFGSRPREQAVSEIRQAARTGLGFVSDRVHQAQQAYQEKQAMHGTADLSMDGWTDLRASAGAEADEVLYPPAYEFDLNSRTSDDFLDEIGEESFPSSDPPSSWAGADNRPAGS